MSKDGKKKKERATAYEKPLKIIGRLVKKVGKHTPEEPPKKPKKAPTVAQLEKVYKLDKRNMTIK